MGARAELAPRDFMALVKDAALAALPFAQPKYRIHGTLLQMCYFEWPQNYEVYLGAHEGRTDRVRVHLGFCGESDENRRRLAVVVDAFPEIMRALDMDLDVYERNMSNGQVRCFVGFSAPRRPLDEAFAAELGGLLSRFMEALEPVVGPLGPLPWTPAQARELAKRRVRQRWAVS